MEKKIIDVIIEEDSMDSETDYNEDSYIGLSQENKLMKVI